MVNLPGVKFGGVQAAKAIPRTVPNRRTPTSTITAICYEMTVSYNQDIINTHSLTFLRVIFRWRGSLWKSVLYEVTLWLLCYYAVMFIYRTQLKKQQQIEFEHIAKYTDGKMDYIPLSFMHGFYVAFVVDRCQNVQLANIFKMYNFGWKQIFANIGFVDSAAFVVGTFVGGTDAEARTHRRNFIRYLCLTQVLVLRDISIRVRRRFPSTESLVETGYLQENEREMMESIQNGFPRYWVPIHWIFTLAHQLTLRGRLTPGQMEMILNESKVFREVVFLATRVYFLLCLFSRQFRIWEQMDSVVYFEYYFPLMTFLQLICYMGWLKVAESLLNPLGEDDEDFESSYIIDRNLAVGMTMVDEFYAHLPIQKPDKFGKEGEIPPMYTEPSLNDPQHPLVGSAKLAADCDPNKIGNAAVFSADFCKEPLAIGWGRRGRNESSAIDHCSGHADGRQQPPAQCQLRTKKMHRCGNSANRIQLRVLRSLLHTTTTSVGR
uniref:Bestrophin homolog n=1 Tax=Globodera pallida TaxID=36090 RepID=A0A183BIS0_GLOPA